jgi:hypothetical protein
MSLIAWDSGYAGSIARMHYFRHRVLPHDVAIKQISNNIEQMYQEVQAELQEKMGNTPENR